MTDRATATREKYLRRNPPRPLPGVEKFSRAVVIPAWDEMEKLPETLDSLDAARKIFPVAVIVVVNYPECGDPRASRATAEWLNGRRKKVSSLFYLEAPGLAGGVGAARKIGMDAYLGARSFSSGAPDWIFSLDADATVAPDYFVRAEAVFAREKEISAWTFPCLHRTEDPATEEAVRRYEKYLARYVEKLASAGSPYAVQTIGSAFCVRLDAYLKAGGMKIRRAGEDFYFLCELVKTGKVAALEGAPVVYPSGRISGRTPFGTGRSIARLAANEELDEIPDFCFDQLKEMLDRLNDGRLASKPETWCATLPFAAQRFLFAEKFLPTWEKVLENTPRDPASRRAAFFRWFDGLKTLRFLHFARSMRGSAAM